MKRFALSLAAFLLLAGSAQADALLKPSVAVDGDMVRLGDLFDNIPLDKAQVVVAHAPQPGRKSVADAEWLKKVANLNGISWRPSDPFLQVVVERNGVTITHEQIESDILTALLAQGISPSSEIELSNRFAQITGPVGSASQIGIHDLFFDPKTKRFTAAVEVPEGAPSAQRFRVSGRVFTTIDVPVPARAIQRGDVIEARDLTWQRIREDGLRRDVLLDVDQIAGMAPKQMLRAGQVVSMSDVQRPVAVTRGSLVTMVLRAGAMSLSAQGRAVEQGSVGDVVRVTNTKSNMTVEGRVQGPNLVFVSPNGGMALSN